MNLAFFSHFHWHTSLPFVFSLHIKNFKEEPKVKKLNADLMHQSFQLCFKRVGTDPFLYYYSQKIIPIPLTIMHAMAWPCIIILAFIQLLWLPKSIGKNRGWCDEFCAQQRKFDVGQQTRGGRCGFHSQLFSSTS